MKESESDRGGSERTAVEWFTLLQSGRAREADWTLFETWLNASPENTRSFEAIEDLWVDLDLASDLKGRRETARVLPFTTRRKAISWGPWAAAAGGVAAAVAIGAAVLLSPRPIAPVLEQKIATAKGERKAIVVAGGTQVDLDSASVIFVSSANKVRLVQGQAAFIVRHDPSRRFEVAAGDRMIVDVGTVFDVARLGDAVQVTVKQGEVAVGPATGNAAPSDLGAGHQLLHRDGQIASIVRAVDADEVLAWKQGRLIYRNAPLQTVVADLNRYFATPIHVEGARAAGLRFSGVLMLDSESAVIGRLQAFLPVVVERSSEGVWLRIR